MQTIWMTFVLLCSALLEICLGRFGVSLPLVCLCAFHFFVMRTWRSALLFSWCFGVFVDLAFSRPLPVHLVLLPAMLLLGRLWRRNQLTGVAFFQVFPGMLAGVMASVALHALVLSSYLDIGWRDFLSVGWRIVCCGVLAGACAPLLLWVLDRLSGVLGLARFSRIGAEAFSSSSAEYREENGA